MMFRQSEERRKDQPNFLFSNQYLFYNDLFFSVFNIIATVNKVSVKYKTKNIITEVTDVFLITINQIRAKTNSRRNLTDTDTRVCIAVLSGSRVCPLKKMKSCKKANSEKSDVSMTKSDGLKLIPVDDESNNPPTHKIA